MGNFYEKENSFKDILVERMKKDFDSAKTIDDLEKTLECERENVIMFIFEELFANNYINEDEKKGMVDKYLRELCCYS